MTVAALLVAVLSVTGYVFVGEVGVLAVVVAGVAGLTWRVAAASRPRPPRGAVERVARARRRAQAHAQACE
ncbi:hypothetical protein EKH77_20260 [Streptomyces luteoverticillatus]|uniref:Uncharacterized protein n=1 Tax=Streptomyces luteoverticillatus TaxID=66425 RepID=A0A3Q9G186_STRLT|nr:hypothetical protein [Streptomyces luteoverticillatus]AZQ73234.1 hypothetical protein EKH77_20260 [Streptomyces luteoverticillatus]